MKKDDRSRRIDEIVNRLSDISEEDKRIIQPQSTTPVTVSLAELLAYGERYELRQKLHDELRKIASQPIDE